MIRKHNTVLADLEADTLRPWMLKLALWYAQQPRKPTFKALHTQARAFSGAPLREDDTRRLVANPAFKDRVRKLFEEPADQARATMESFLVEMVTIHRETVEACRAEGRWDKMAPLLTPYLDRVWPKTEGPKLPPAVVNINLGGGFAKQYHGTVEVEEAQIVEVEEVTE